MEDIIKLYSRNETKSNLKKLEKVDGSESKTYILKTDSAYIRVGYLNNNHQFIDLDGGPMIIEGEVLKEANAKVSSINFAEGFGYTITFK